MNSSVAFQTLRDADDDLHNFKGMTSCFEFFLNNLTSHRPEHPDITSNTLTYFSKCTILQCFSQITTKKKKQKRPNYSSYKRLFTLLSQMVCVRNSERSWLWIIQPFGGWSPGWTKIGLQVLLYCWLATWRIGCALSWGCTKYIGIRPGACTMTCWKKNQTILTGIAVEINT